MKASIVKVLMVLVVIFIGFTPSALAGADECIDTIPQLTVRGESVLHVPADQMQLSIGVVTSALTAGEALDANTKKMRDVEKALARKGLTKEEYKTGQFQVQPQWEPRPREMRQDWLPRIVGYKVSNTLDITTKKLELAGELIETGVEAGANDISSVRFELADPRKFRAEAIKAATFNARADALSLSGAASVRLAGILSARLDEAEARPIALEMESFSEKAMFRAGSAPQITAGDVTVHASVTITYQLEQE